MKNIMITLIVLSMGNAIAMENLLLPEFLGKEISITKEQWKKLPAYFNRYGLQVVVIKTADGFSFGQTLQAKDPRSSDVKVSDDVDGSYSSYDEELVRLTLDWQSLMHKDQD